MVETEPSNVKAPLAPGSAEWWARRRAPRRPDALSADRIVTTALAILDAEGSDALTMRRIAEELNTKAASLYRHIDNREALLVEVIDRVLGEIELDVPDADWQEQARYLARHTRAAFQRHPGIAPLLSMPALGPNAMRFFDTGIQVCLNAGFPSDLAVAACQAIAFLVRSFAVFENADSDPIMVAPGALTGVEDRFPHIAAVSDDIRPGGADEMFEFFLTATIDGLARRLDQL